MHKRAGSLIPKVIKAHKPIKVFKKKLPPAQYSNYYVLDFETTCDQPQLPVVEIIEFPVLKVCGSTFKVLDKFHSYVKPVLNPELTDCCINLTKIDQPSIDASPEFPEVLARFNLWMEDQLEKDRNYLVVTYGDEDLRIMLPKQCQLSDVPIPSTLTSWMNIKMPIADVKTVFPTSFLKALGMFGLKFNGQHHSGIDDCHNLVNLLEQLQKCRAHFRPTSRRLTS